MNFLLSAKTMMDLLTLKRAHEVISLLKKSKPEIVRHFGEVTPEITIDVGVLISVPTALSVPSAIQKRDELQEWFRVNDGELHIVVSLWFTLEEIVWMEPIPSYGHLMPVAEFLRDCENESLIDYDGSGNYATETEMSNIAVWPSKILEHGPDPRFTHVVWFNK